MLSLAAAVPLTIGFIRWADRHNAAYDDAAVAIGLAVPAWILSPVFAVPPLVVGVVLGSAALAVRASNQVNRRPSR